MKIKERTSVWWHLMVRNLLVDVEMKEDLMLEELEPKEGLA